MENQPAPPHQETALQKFWLFFMDTLQTVGIAGVLFFIIYLFLFRPFQVSGDSMFSSFEDRDYILTSLITLRFHAPQRGDVIVFTSPTDPDKDFIKRVVGIPGDTVVIKDGSVYVNNQRIDESNYLDAGMRTFGGSDIKENQLVTLTTDQYFVMGDNRTNSSDSREWGVLPKKNIIGTSLLVYFPFNHFRIIQNPFQ